MQRMEFDNDGVTISAAVHGSDSDPTVLLLHGFPQTSHCWHHQIDPLVAAGYHVVTPDLRGFGQSDVPQEVDSYLIGTVVADVTSVIEGLGLEKAVVVGHDWGASLAWTTAALAPDRVRAVAALSVPFTRRPSSPPIERLVEKAGGLFFYMDYFQTKGPAEAEFEADPRGLLLAMLHTASGAGTPRMPGPRGSTKLSDQQVLPDALPPWLSEEDLDAYVMAFAKTGWTGALNWYRAMDPSWRAFPTVGTVPLPMPSAFLAGEKDLVLAFTPRKHHAELLTDLREELILPGIGHWVAEEAPQQTTDFLLRFLSQVAV